MDIKRLREMAGLPSLLEMAGRQHPGQTVGGMITLLTIVVQQLQKFPANTKIVHVLSPNGSYSGDTEDTFVKISVNAPEADDPDQAVVLDLVY